MADDEEPWLEWRAGLETRLAALIDHSAERILEHALTVESDDRGRSGLDWIWWQILQPVRIPWNDDNPPTRQLADAWMRFMQAVVSEWGEAEDTIDTVYDIALEAHALHGTLTTVQVDGFDLLPGEVVHRDEAGWWDHMVANGRDEAWEDVWDSEARLTWTSHRLVIDVEQAPNADIAPFRVEVAWGDVDEVVIPGNATYGQPGPPFEVHVGERILAPVPEWPYGGSCLAYRLWNDHRKDRA